MKSASSQTALCKIFLFLSRFISIESESKKIVVVFVLVVLVVVGLDILAFVVGVDPRNLTLISHQ